MTLELGDLAPPQVIETLSYQAIKDALLADFVARAPDFSALLESDPIVKLLEVAAYRELLLRARINQAARANLLAFATGGDLDHLAAFYGVTRKAGEADDDMRLRVRDHIIGFSVGGSAAAYRFQALSAHPDIEDVSVSSPGGGLVNVALLPRIDAGDNAALVSAVEAKLNDPALRILTDRIDVSIATAQPLMVIARVWLRPDVPDSRIAELDAGLRQALKGERRLGWDVTRSWLVAQLHRAGVYRIDLEAPAGDLSVGPDAWAEIGDVTLLLQGRQA